MRFGVIRLEALITSSRVTASSRGWGIASQSQGDAYFFFFFFFLICFRDTYLSSSLAGTRRFLTVGIAAEPEEHER
jgi:hypothetical protein